MFLRRGGISHQYKNQISASLLATINAISDGMQYGWTAPIVPFLQSEDSFLRITKSEENYLELIYLLGGLASLPLTIHFCDKIGRKKTIIAASYLSLLAWILIPISVDIRILYLARFLAGLAGDVAFIAAPMYVAEIADQKIRGLLSGIIYLMMLAGILIVYAVVPIWPFYGSTVIGGGLLLYQIVKFSSMPESPYFLILSDDSSNLEAEESLRFFRQTFDVKLELDSIKSAIHRENLENGGFRDLIRVKSNFKALLIVIILNAAQHFCGITVLLMNVHEILIEANSKSPISSNSTSTAVFFGVIMFVSAAISSLYVDKYGRKILLTLSSLLTGLCLMLLAIYFHLKHLGQDLETFVWLPNICVMMYAAVFKFGLGMVPIVLTAELFASKIKALGMTIADGIYIIFGFLSIELYQNVSKSYGVHVTFYVFAASAFLTAVFALYVVPETKGKSLEEIQDILRGRSR